MYRTLIAILVVLMFLSCAKPEDRSCFKGSGDQVEEARSLGYFHSISVYDLIDIHIVQDSTDHVVIRCGENIVNNVSTEVIDGVLTIRDENKCNWLRSLPVDIEVDVHCTEMRNIRTAGSGTLTCEGQIQEDNFEFHNWRTVSKNYLDVAADIMYIKLHAGGSVIEIQGSAEMVYFYNSGRGKIIAGELTSQNIWADNKSEGDILCRINGGIFWYMLDGQGSTSYYGTASEFIEVSREGEGQLIPLE